MKLGRNIVSDKPLRFYKTNNLEIEDVDNLSPNFTPVKSKKKIRLLCQRKSNKESV